MHSFWNSKSSLTEDGTCFSLGAVYLYYSTWSYMLMSTYQVLRSIYHHIMRKDLPEGNVTMKDWGLREVSTSVHPVGIMHRQRESTLFLKLFERSEFLIATCKKKKTDRPDVCLYVRIISWF